MRLVLCTLAMGALAAAPELVRGADGNGPVFSDPLAVTNDYFPMPSVGKQSKKTLASDDGTWGIAIVSPRTRTFEYAGQLVEARELFEIEFLWEWILEVTANYYAQADDGSVYCFGEVTHVIDPPLAGPEYSWLVGGASLPGDPPETIVAAKPALFMPAYPTLGMTWNQVEVGPEGAETALVIGTDAEIELAGIVFEHCLALAVASGGADQHVKLFAPGYGEIYTATRDVESHMVTFRVEP